MHLAHAQVVEQLDHLRPLAQGDRAFEIERHGELALPLRPLDLGHRVDLEEQLRVCGDLRPEARDHRHDLAQGVHVHADVDRHEADPGVAMPAQHRHVDIGVQRQAGMGVPDQGGAVQGGGVDHARHVLVGSCGLASGRD
jgi:hypothetical protein